MITLLVIFLTVYFIQLFIVWAILVFGYIFDKKELFISFIPFSFLFYVFKAIKFLLESMYLLTIKRLRELK